MSDTDEKIKLLQEEINLLKNENERLKSDVKLFNTLLDSMPDTIYFKDEECRFIKINKAQASALGLKKPEDAIGKTDFEFFNPEHAEAAYFDEKNIIRSGRIIINKEERIQKANGEWFYVTATKVPIRDEKGKIIGIVGISRDITRYKSVEK